MALLRKAMRQFVVGLSINLVLHVIMHAFSPQDCAIKLLSEMNQRMAKMLCAIKLLSQMIQRMTKMLYTIASELKCDVIGIAGLRLPPMMF